MAKNQVVLSLERARELAELAVLEKGRDYQYRDVTGPADQQRDCVYYETDGSPSCLVGHVFHYAGVDSKPFLSDSGADWVNGDDVSMLQIPGLAIEYDAEEFLSELQHRQDAGETWGQALDAANAEFAAPKTVEVTPQEGSHAGNYVSAGA